MGHNKFVKKEKGATKESLEGLLLLHQTIAGIKGNPYLFWLTKTKKKKGGFSNLLETSEN